MSENRNTGRFSAADLRRRMAEREAAKAAEEMRQHWLIVVGGRGLDHFGRVVDYWWWAGRWEGIVCSGTNLVGPTPPQHKLSTMC
jgi:hypothetical protein